MKKDIRVNPIGLKGREVTDRMKELMGITIINENKRNSVIELTKIGPDGKVYGIVRENHEYYIKTADNKKNLSVDDFNYMGGLMNKKDEAYNSYAKAIKHLNIKFNSLNEAYNKSGQINVFENDDLILENGYGFSNQGNMEGNESLFEVEKTDEDVELTETEQAVEDLNCDDIKDVKKDIPVKETHRLSISKALGGMDSIIEGITKNEVKKKVYTLK